MSESAITPNMTIPQMLKKTVSGAASYYPAETSKVLFSKTNRTGLGGLIPDVAQAAGADAIKWITTAGFGIGGLAVMEERMKKNYYDDRGWLYDTSVGISKFLAPLVPGMRSQEKIAADYPELAHLDTAALDAKTPEEILSAYRGPERQLGREDGEKEAESVRRALKQRHHNPDVVAEVIWNGVTFWNFLLGYQIGSRLQKLFAPKHKDEHAHDPHAAEHGAEAGHGEAQPKKKTSFVRRAIGEVGTYTRFLFRDCFGAMMGSIPDIVLSLALVKEFRDGNADLEGAAKALNDYAGHLDTLLGESPDPANPRQFLSANSKGLLRSFLGKHDTRFGENGTPLDQTTDTELLLGLKDFLKGKQAELLAIRADTETLPNGTPDHAFILRLKETLEPLKQLSGTILGRYNAVTDPDYDKPANYGIVGFERKAIQEQTDGKEQHYANERLFRHMGNTLDDIVGGVGRMEAGTPIKGNHYLHSTRDTIGDVFHKLLGKEGLLGKATGGRVGVDEGLADEWAQYGMIASVAFAPFNFVRSTWYRVFDMMFPESPEMAKATSEKSVAQHAAAITRENIAHVISVSLGCILPMAIGAVGMTKSRKTGRFGDALADVYTTGEVRTEGRGDLIGHGVNMIGNVLKKMGITEAAQGIVGYREGQFLPYLPVRTPGQDFFSALIDKFAMPLAR